MLGAYRRVGAGAGVRGHTGGVNDFVAYRLEAHGIRSPGVRIRPAELDDVARVAQLLALRGCGIDDALEQAPRMIASLPVLLVACLPPEDPRAGGPGDPAVDRLRRSGAPVALSGAFVVPDEMAPPGGWMVSGLVVDPSVRRRGIGRMLLTAVVEQAGRVAPGQTLRSVVNATNRASLALHRTVGFRRVKCVSRYAGITFEGGKGVLLAREP